MLSFDDYIVYVDESGDHSLTSIDRQYPIFVLAFCLFDKEKYAERITTDITHLKFKYFGHDQIILHEREIRKEEAEFSILRQEHTRTNSMETFQKLSGKPRSRYSQALLTNGDSKRSTTILTTRTTLLWGSG